MIIYHCRIDVYIYENEPEYVSASEVFTTLDEAKDWGLKEINEKVQKLVDKIIPADYEGEDIDECIDSTYIQYM